MRRAFPELQRRFVLMSMEVDVKLRCFQSSKDTSKLKLKLVEHGVPLHDVEELDLADEPLEAESALSTPWQYPPMSGVLPIEGKPGSVRISNRVPQFSYTSGSQPNLALIGHFDDHDRSSPDFPLPSALLGTENIFEYGLKPNSDIFFPTWSNEESELTSITDAVPPATKSFENSDFDFNTFKALENASLAHASLCRKRAAFPSPLRSEAKCRRIADHDEASKAVKQQEPETVREEIKPEIETKRPLPDWVAEFDQDLIAFFGDSVVYAE
jgi:hypothetical protein